MKKILRKKLCMILSMTLMLSSVFFVASNDAKAALTYNGYHLGATTKGLCPYYGLQIYPNAYSILNTALVECNGAANKYCFALWTEYAHSSNIYPCNDGIDRIYTMADANADYVGQISYFPNSSGELVSADINFNTRYPFSLTNSNTVLNSYDMLSVFTHELGHFMGLSHYTDNSNAVMYTYADIGRVCRKFVNLERQYVYNLYN